MMRGLLCALFSLAVARAQTATPAPEATGSVAESVFGSVSGHVYCADTNAPARFATVTLQPAPEKTEASPGKRIAPAPQSAPPATRTGLDGGFHFSVVRPGTYFLVADYPGYVSPIAKLSADELKSKEPSDIEKVEKLLVKVTVAANKDSGSEIELERGAAIAGTVRYDDGSPANEIQIAVLRLQDDGEASTVSVNLSGQGRSHFDLRNPGLETNDLGHYRVSGLPAGKYVVMTTLPTITTSFRGLLGGPPATESRMDEAGALSVYSGNVFREKDAKPIELIAGTERDGSDITIPLLGLHNISGSVTALADGHAINWGSVVLLRADDKSVVRSFHISENPNDG
ncbi:MAG: carboxypeptidase-like regulatory domain-containing protein, partial [Silvibacterium sp.]